MDTNKFNTTALTPSELEQTDGGFIFLLFAVSGMLTNMAAGAVLVAPVASGVVKGWDDYEK